MKKRSKRLTRRERKAVETAGGSGHAAHIHCIACGRHINPDEFVKSPTSARYLRCQHGSKYASCTPCVPRAMELLREHDRTGQAVRIADAWH